MSYSSSGFLSCNPFIYWGNIQEDWAQFVRRIDPRDYLWKARYVDEFIKYLDRVEFCMDGDLYNDDCDSLDWDWFFSRHGMVYHNFSIEMEDWFGEFDNEILFPLSRNKFPFHFLSEDQINEIVSERESHQVTREALLKEIPRSLDREEDLEEFVRNNLDIVNAVGNLCLYNIKISSPEPKYGAELENRNFDEHMGLDALLAFLARAGVVNKYFRDWMVTCQMTGEDGEEFSIVRKISGNEVIDPNQRTSSW
jgi:hypothetical protein